ncbi:MAG TPA: hypothetical protein PKD79_02620 [Candidatus Doudnabacteria bacterium]|nr:hypothetical protein [Candidatus Doudnabacteria bacterium]
MKDLEKYLCPSCGFKFLVSLYDEDGEFDAVDEICPACGYTFGYTDINSGYSYKDWRHKWISEGLNWWSKRESEPQWNPVEQLKGIGVELDSNNNIVKEPEEPEWHKKWIHKD